MRWQSHVTLPHVACCSGVPENIHTAGIERLIRCVGSTVTRVNLCLPRCWTSGPTVWTCERGPTTTWLLRANTQDPYATPAFLGAYCHVSPRIIYPDPGIYRCTVHILQKAGSVLSLCITKVHSLFAHQTHVYVATNMSYRHTYSVMARAKYCLQRGSFLDRVFHAEEFC